MYLLALLTMLGALPALGAPFFTPVDTDSREEKAAIAHYYATYKNPDHTVRRDAVLAFIAVQPTGANAQLAIVKSLLDPHAEVRAAAIETLSKITITEAGVVGMVANLAQHKNLEVRRSATIALGSINGPTSSIRSLTLLRATSDADAEIRESAEKSLQQVKVRYCESLIADK